MPHRSARIPRPVRRRAARAFVLAACGFAIFLAGGYPAAADDEEKKEPPREAPAAPEVAVSEEVLVVGEKERASTEMDRETARLLAIAGAADDPLQAIYALPGVAISGGDDGPDGSEPVIRGSAPHENAYFVDLIPARYIFHLFGNSIFDKQVIGSFDLYPAAFPSQYGNATGGVIDVTLREPRNQRFKTTLHTSLLSAGALVETGIGEKQALFATYRRSTMDLILDEDDIDDAEEEGFRIDRLPVSDDYQLKYSWQPDGYHRLSVVAAGAADSLAATFDVDSQEALSDPDFAGPASLSQSFDSQGIVWNWQKGSRDATSVFSHVAQSDQLVYGKDQHEFTDSDRYLARSFYRQAVSDRHSVSLGLSLEQVTYDLHFDAKFVACNDLDPECSTVDAEYVTYRDSLELFAQEGFLEDTWSFGGQQTLTLGLHYAGDDYLGSGGLEPRLRLDYWLTEKVSAHLAAGRHSQLPELREMIEVLGNPNLERIESDHYEVGLGQLLGGGWRWSADAYYKDMKNVVISAEQDDGAENYSNDAEGRAYGAELLLRKDLTRRWYGWAALSLAKSERTNAATGETIRFEFDKPVLFNLVASRLLGKSWTIGCRFTFQSGGRYTPIVGLLPSATHPGIFEPVYGRLNSEVLPDYHRLDLRAEYTRPQNWGYWKLYVDILNLYDRNNVSAYEYAPDGRELIPPPPGFGLDVPVAEETSEGLFPSIGFELQF